MSHSGVAIGCRIGYCSGHRAALPSAATHRSLRWSPGPRWLRRAAGDALTHEGREHRTGQPGRRAAVVRRPLGGYRVLDLTNVLAGPFCCHQQAHLGAEIIKIELPGSGDFARQLGPDHKLNAKRMGGLVSGPERRQEIRHAQPQAPPRQAPALGPRSGGGRSGRELSPRCDGAARPARGRKSSTRQAFRREACSRFPPSSTTRSSATASGWLASPVCRDSTETSGSSAAGSRSMLRQRASMGRLRAGAGTPTRCSQGSGCPPGRSRSCASRAWYERRAPALGLTARTRQQPSHLDTRFRCRPRRRPR